MFREIDGMAQRRACPRRLCRARRRRGGYRQDSPFARCHHEMRVLWGACDALFTPEPLAPLHDIARQTQGALLTAVTSGANLVAIFSAVLDEVEHANALWRLRKFGRYGRFSPRLRGGVALPARRGSRILKSATWIPGGCICSRTGHA